MAELIQLRIGLVEIPVEPLDGVGPDGVAGVAQGAEPVVKFHTGPEVELPQLFFATIFQ